MAMTKLEQAHQEADHFFRNLLPQQGMAVREGQVSLCHTMLDALFQKKIALCDAGVGIGKTYAYLAACVLLKKHRPSHVQTIVVSTSSVALQEAITQEYLPFLSQVLVEGGILSSPIRFAVRKGKGRYVCDQRLLTRLQAVQDKPKNPLQRQALDSLRWKVDLDTVPHLSGFDRRLVCVPKTCLKDCPQQTFCRYHRTQQQAGTDQVFLQICNHNYLLADAAHRQQGLRPLLRDYQALIVDEAHKLPEAARQMYGVSLSWEDLRELCYALERERLFSPAQRLRVQAGALWESLKRFEDDPDAPQAAFRLTPPRRTALQACCALLKQLPAQLGARLPRHLTNQLKKTAGTLGLFLTQNEGHILTVEYSREGNPSLVAHSQKVPQLLRQALWERESPVILTSGTLAAGGSFQRSQTLLGLGGDTRVKSAVIPSPFPYEKNCLLYLPNPPHRVLHTVHPKSLGLGICRHLCR